MRKDTAGVREGPLPPGPAWGWPAAPNIAIAVESVMPPRMKRLVDCHPVALLPQYSGLRVCSAIVSLEHAAWSIGIQHAVAANQRKTRRRTGSVTPRIDPARCQDSVRADDDAKPRNCCPLRLASFSCCYRGCESMA